MAQVHMKTLIELENKAVEAGLDSATAAIATDQLMIGTNVEEIADGVILASSLGRWVVLIGNVLTSYVELHPRLTPQSLLGLGFEYSDGRH